MPAYVINVSISFPTPQIAQTYLTAIQLTNPPLPGETNVQYAGRIISELLVDEARDGLIKQAMAAAAAGVLPPTITVIAT